MRNETSASPGYREVSHAVTPPRGAAERPRPRILLAEDDADLRRSLRATLGRSGYAVVDAADGVEALRLAKDCQDDIELLITDLVMPRMNGPELAARLVAERPGVRVLYMSGYPVDEMNRRGVLPDHDPCLTKPFRPDVLLRSTRAMLDVSP